MARRRTPTLKQVQRDLADVMDMVHHYLLTPYQAGRAVDMQEVTRLTTSYVQTVQTYMKLAGVVDLEEEVGAIREELRELREGSLRA